MQHMFWVGVGVGGVVVFKKVPDHDAVFLIIPMVKKKKVQKVAKCVWCYYKMFASILTKWILFLYKIP